MLALVVALPVGAEQAPLILGASEKVGLRELGMELPARLDTGAVSMSLSAYEVESFERDGEEWVRFRLGVDNGVDLPVELPVDSSVRIRRRAEDRGDDEDEFSRRYVVRLTACIGARSAEVRVNLADRRDFSYPLLVGREALEELGILVDAAREKVGGEPGCLDPEQEPPVHDEEDRDEEEADEEDADAEDAGEEGREDGGSGDEGGEASTEGNGGDNGDGDT